ncbi:UPF0280 family protein [Acuticoccus sp. MNP-M23]|uniref:UPF0280 family protein n=1 Tax=Acuticoccus sp. MNP-M23 TaxID=3072793 RepID=UPI002814AC95|nr:UPF0280 family protein [Acuticoccus sp. MNP-M23]WMS44042.1 UPF0280 family protein [Acuticoccus sp. MNP-M23]
MERASAHRLADGRLHLSHGPIDLVISAEGAADAVTVAEAAATARFATILAELAAELPALRTAGGIGASPVGARMTRAVAPHTAFVTPMAAVAGAVADEVLVAMIAAAPLTRAIVNNGGDIALHLAPGTKADARIALGDGSTAGHIAISAGDGIGGIATSGRHGRSLSLGIADSVTVLAPRAAEADAAATLIANAVDLPGSPAIIRTPANLLDPDSDLGTRPVTTAVGPLSRAEVAEALERGASAAREMQAEGLIAATALILAGEGRTVGTFLNFPIITQGNPDR